MPDLRGCPIRHLLSGSGDLRDVDRSTAFCRCGTDQGPRLLAASHSLAPAGCPGAPGAGGDGRPGEGPRQTIPERGRDAPGPGGDPPAAGHRDAGPPRGDGKCPSCLVAHQRSGPPRAAEFHRRKPSDPASHSARRPSGDPDPRRSWGNRRAPAHGPPFPAAPHLHSRAHLLPGADPSAEHSLYRRLMDEPHAALSQPTRCPFPPHAPPAGNLGRHR